MSNERNKAMHRRFYEEVISGGNLVALDEIMDVNFDDNEEHNPMETLMGLELVKKDITMYRSAFPDVHFTVEDQTAEGDRIATRWTARGTHAGALWGIPPTGKQVMVTGIVIMRVADGKFVEGWAIFDALGLLQQLGAVPSMG